MAAALLLQSLLHPRGGVSQHRPPHCRSLPWALDSIYLYRFLLRTRYLVLSIQKQFPSSSLALAPLLGYYTRIIIDP